MAELLPGSENSSSSTTDVPSSSKEDESDDFNCVYRWFNVCPQHRGPYPAPQNPESPDDFVIRLDAIQSVWMQAGWLLMAFFGGGASVLLARCFVKAESRLSHNSSRKAETWFSPEREQMLEFILGVLTIISILDFADSTCELEQGKRYFDAWKQPAWYLENLTAILLLFSVSLRLYTADLRLSTFPRTRYFFTSPLLWSDVLAMTPTLLDLILPQSFLQYADLFPNLIWLRMPRMVDVSLRAGHSEEGAVRLGNSGQTSLVELEHFVQNWSSAVLCACAKICVAEVYLLGAMWLACSTIHFLTERDNEEFYWGSEPGYHRYVSIPSGMYYALIDFHGEFPNADEFSRPLGRMNSMVICMVGTALLSVPAGVLGAAFQDHISSRLSRGLPLRSEERRPPPCSAAWGACMVGLVLLSTANFVLLTRVYQQPVRESHTEGRAYGADGWQASAVAPCRYLDIIFALPFLVHWSQRLLCAAHIREYLLSSVHLADLLAWLPSYFLCISLLLHGSCQEFQGSQRQAYYSREQLAFHGMCMFRWIKLDSFFGGMFEQLRQVLAENYVIFRITFILATALWISGSVLMYYAERDNPDEGTRDHFRTLPLSFWMTGLDFTSEAPVNDHSAQGKAVHTLIMLVGVGVFTVPMGVFGAAFRERLDEMHAQLLMSRPNAPRKSTEVRRGSGTAVLLAQEELDNMSVVFSTLAQERASGVYRDVHDVDDEHLMRLQPGSRKYRWYRLLMGKRHPGNGAGAKWLQHAIVAVTALCCFASCVETLTFFDDCEATAAAAEDMDTGLGFTLRAASCSTYSHMLSAVSMLCLLCFLAEFVARCWSHPQPWKMFLHPTGVADLLVIAGSLPITLVYLGGFSVSYRLRNFAVTLRLWRLAALERYVPAFGDFLEVLAGRGYQMLQVCYVLTSFWFILAAYNWYFLHGEFEVKSEDKTFACWYSNFWFAMQFTLIHMSGDYPMTEYPVKVRLVHACSLFSAWAFVTMPAAMLTSAFHDALEKRRILAAQQRNQALCKIVRLLRRIILRRRFRGVAERALAEHSKQMTSVGLARKKYPRLAWLLMFLHSDERYLFVLGTATVFHVGAASLRTIPQLQPEAMTWDVIMLPFILFFALNLLGRGCTAFMNPSYRCSALFFVSSYQRILQLVAFCLYFYHLAKPGDERRLKRACAAQVSFIVNFGQILGTSPLLNLVWAEIRESVIVMSFAIKACAKSASWTKALRLLSDLKTMPTTRNPTIISYNSAISACEKGRPARIGQVLCSAAMAFEADKASAADVLRECFGQGGDFTITVEECAGEDSGEDGAIISRSEFRVWSVLLAKWSKVFDKMINSNSFAESAQAQMVIKDFSAAAVETFLRFLYSGVVEGSIPTLVEVGTLADKYQVDKLSALCFRAVQNKLQPEVACELFACADRFQVADLRRQALEQILIYPKEALKTRPVLNPRLLNEVLDSPLLCIEDADLMSILQGWGKRKASATENDAVQPLIDSRVSNLQKRKPGEHSTDVLQTLWSRYANNGKTDTFLGYWVSIILGTPCILNGIYRSIDEGNRLAMLQGCAANSRNCLPLRFSKGWIVWMLPHHSVYLTGFSFAHVISSLLHFEILCSRDGCDWHLAVSSEKREIPAKKTLSCRQPPHLVKWFKLQVLEGEFINNFGIHGILQTDCNVWVQAVALLEDARAERLELQVITYNAAISACEKGSQWPLAIALLAELPQVALDHDVISFNAAISACGRGSQWAVAAALLRQLQETDMQLTVITYGAAISAAEKGQQWEWALKLLSEMRGQRLLGNVITCSAAISACEKAGRWQESWQLLQEIDDATIELDVISLSAVVSACGRASQWRHAVELLGDMQQRHVQGNLVTYNSMLSGLEKAGQWQLALSCLAELQDELELDVITYSAVISACEKCGRWQEALLVLVDMQRRRLSGNDITYNASISACQKGGQWRLALQLLSDFDILSLQRDEISYSAAISACEAGYQWQKSLLLLADLLSFGFETNIITYNAALSACAESSSWEEPLLLLTDLQELRLTANTITCSVAISACEMKSQWPEAMYLLEDLQAKSCRSNLLTYSFAVGACASAGQGDSLLSLLLAVSGTFWVLSATLWYLAEGGEQGMTDMFSTLYYTCIFLLGEWCSFDFSPVGAGLSMLYSIVGVGLNAMPMAAVQIAKALDGSEFLGRSIKVDKKKATKGKGDENGKGWGMWGMMGKKGGKDMGKGWWGGWWPGGKGWKGWGPY
ncbi:unnamed protein product [Symbiodinium necroappetens]|uniref:BTB domain-containing protein n=1 Tax=Symbiodinium necroappetens TaxID=1628268 RepID=A0A812ITC9_9DINO|nr:unnamed protein product [Symbiodinium necroappetens]